MSPHSDDHDRHGGDSHDHGHFYGHDHGHGDLHTLVDLMTSSGPAYHCEHGHEGLHLHSH